MVHSRHYKNTYSDDDVTQLCRIGGLYPEDMAEFREKLENFAAVYRWESEKYADLPRSSDVSRDLKSLFKRINRLDAGLENLPEEAAHALTKAVDNNNQSDTALIITKKLPNDAPSLTDPSAPGICHAGCRTEFKTFGIQAGPQRIREGRPRRY